MDKDTWFEKIVLAACAVSGAVLVLRGLRLAVVGSALLCRGVMTGKKAAGAGKRSTGRTPPPGTTP